MQRWPFPKGVLLLERAEWLKTVLLLAFPCLATLRDSEAWGRLGPARRRAALPGSVRPRGRAERRPGLSPAPGLGQEAERRGGSAETLRQVPGAGPGAPWALPGAPQGLAGRARLSGFLPPSFLPPPGINTDGVSRNWCVYLCRTPQCGTVYMSKKAGQPSAGYGCWTPNTEGRLVITGILLSCLNQFCVSSASTVITPSHFTTLCRRWSTSKWSRRTRPAERTLPG